jgi:hypothetical protein
LKPDCTCAHQRKRPQNLPAGFSGTLSLVRFEGKTYGIAAISSGTRPGFSATRTAWGRDRNSNFLYGLQAGL